MSKITSRISTVLAMLWMGAQPMFASGTGGTGLPWEGPLQTVQRSLSGPVAFSIAVIAMASVGGMLVFGGELTEFTRKACMLVLAIAFLVGGAGLITLLFGVSGALV